ncbi:SAM-dependent methyltransferase [Nocardia sp. NPDC048505]|uniref:class I SAM-dependent DNA methyltransferase n=1 Tax=Nocardia sp. NPDC048505 TaxID=3155756 RepID=UPI0034079C01
MTLPSSYFEDMYAAAADPWSFTTRWYERRKRALTMAALPNPRYRSAFEPGCSIGTLTEQLVTRCDRVLASDPIAKALDAAAVRLDADRDRVELRRWSLGDDWPAARFDLIVFSEVCYYLDADTLRTVTQQAVAHLEPGGTLLVVHWRHPVPDYPLTGDEVHDIVSADPGLVRMSAYQDEDMRLEVFTTSHPEPRSVARRGGLL